MIDRRVKLKRSKSTADNCHRNGEMFEQLAALALQKSGFERVCNLNQEMQIHFTFADLLACRNEVWYAVTVKGRHKFEHCGKLNDRYKIPDMEKKAGVAIAEIRQVKGIEVAPAFAAVVIEGGCYSVYFDLLEKTRRKNAIGMKEQEKNEYECLVRNEPHGLPIVRNTYTPIAAGEWSEEGD